MAIWAICSRLMMVFAKSGPVRSVGVQRWPVSPQFGFLTHRCRCSDRIPRWIGRKHRISGEALDVLGALAYRKKDYLVIQ
jgi:hypothetical protein